MKNIYLLTLSPLLLLACNSAHHSENQSPIPDTLVYHYNTFLLQSKHVVENDGKKDTTYFKTVYPIFDVQAINEIITQEVIADTAHHTIEEEGKAFITSFDDFIKMDEYPRAWYSETHIRVIQNTPNYLALATEVSDYTGGAHGNYATLFFNYNPVDKDSIGLSQIIGSKQYLHLTGIAEEVFRKQEGLTPEQPLDDNYFFEENTFHLPANFTLTSNGILFLYNIYEIKPYVSGITKLLIPYEKIDSLLTPQAKQIIEEIKHNE